MPNRFLPLGLVALLLLAACSGPRALPPDLEPAPVEPVGPPPYETFDPSDYHAEPPPKEAEVDLEHDVPAELMAGRIAEPETPEPDGPVIVEGYRIQLFSSESKPSADAVRDDVANWWRQASSDPELDEAFEFGLRPVVIFSRPYYRVRVGAFPDRESAAPALNLIRDRFPEAFLVPDTITLGGGEG